MERQSQGMRDAVRRRAALPGVALAGLLVVSAAVGTGQISQTPVPGSRPQSASDPFPPPPGANEHPLNAAKMEHMREDERRKRLLADTTKLVELTNQLKEAVDKSTRDELSLDVVRKAAEIEKLARDVKDRMKS